MLNVNLFFHYNVELLEESPELVIKGIRYAMKVTGAKEAYIGIKAKNDKAIEVIKNTLKRLR